MIPIPSSLREKKEIPGHIKSEWLGVEARVHLPPRMLAGNRFLDRQRRSSLARLLVSFLSGIAMGGVLAFFVTRVENGSVMPSIVKAINPSQS